MSVIGSLKQWDCLVQKLQSPSEMALDEKDTADDGRRKSQKFRITQLGSHSKDLLKVTDRLPQAGGVVMSPADPKLDSRQARRIVKGLCYGFSFI
jgi:hypothetical protein